MFKGIKKAFKVEFKKTSVFKIILAAMLNRISILLKEIFNKNLVFRIVLISITTKNQIMETVNNSQNKIRININLVQVSFSEIQDFLIKTNIKKFKISLQ